MPLFTPYLIHREEKRAPDGFLFVEVRMQPLSPPLKAETPEQALSLAQQAYPLFPHRLAIGDHHVQN